MAFDFFGEVGLDFVEDLKDNGMITSAEIYNHCFFYKFPQLLRVISA
jgi:hypothetical protein